MKSQGSSVKAAEKRLQIKTDDIVANDDIDVSFMYLNEGEDLMKVDRLIRVALADIRNPRKKLYANREIGIKIVLAPETEQKVDVKVEVKSKLAPYKSTETMLVIGQKPDGGIIARETHQYSIIEDILEADKKETKQ